MDFENNDSFLDGKYLLVAYSITMDIDKADCHLESKNTKFNLPWNFSKYLFEVISMFTQSLNAHRGNLLCHKAKAEESLVTPGSHSLKYDRQSISAWDRAPRGVTVIWKERWFLC